MHANSLRSSQSRAHHLEIAAEAYLNHTSYLPSWMISSCNCKTSTQFLLTGDSFWSVQVSYEASAPFSCQQRILCSAVNATSQVSKILWSWQPPCTMSPQPTWRWLFCPCSKVQSVTTSQDCTCMAQMQCTATHLQACTLSAHRSSFLDARNALKSLPTIHAGASPYCPASLPLTL